MTSPSTRVYAVEPNIAVPGLYRTKLQTRMQAVEGLRNGRTLFLSASRTEATTVASKINQAIAARVAFVVV